MRRVGLAAKKSKGLARSRKAALKNEGGDKNAKG